MENTSELSPAMASQSSLPQPAQGGRERTQGWLAEDRRVIKYSWEEYRTRLRGRTRYEAIMYVAKRDSVDGHVFCVGCNTEITDLQHGVTLNHINFDNADNHRWNFNLYHHPCNSSRKRSTLPRHSTVGESENGSVYVASVGSELEVHWSSREGETSDKMNAAVDVWLNDMEGGPFVVRSQGKVVLRPIEIKFLSFMGAAVLRANPNIKRGSPITLERYLWTRSVGKNPNEPGMLKIQTDTQTGDKMVYYRGKNLVIQEDKSKTGEI